MAPNIPHSDSATAKANGMEIVYDTFGDPDKPPVLLIIGLGQQMIAWDEELCAQIAARGYRVIRFDNRDTGLSTKLDEEGVPTLIIHGDADLLVPVECGIDTANSVPGSELLIIEGMGHTFPRQVWAQVIDAIVHHAV